MKQLEISDAVTLWKTFAKTAHFNDTEYDADLEKSIRSSLGLSRKGTMAEQLQKQDVSVERLLYAIFEATEPFSAMLNDLLQMFERASAQSSSTNLQIKFDFDVDRKPFSFDLDHFRKTVHITSRRILQKDIRILQDPWRLIDMFRYDIPTCAVPPIRSSQIGQWLKEYFDDDKWPDFWLAAPEAGVSELDQITREIWEMIRSAISYYRQAYEPKRGRKLSHSDENHRRNRDPIWQMETDLWVGRLVESMTREIEGLQALQEKERSEKARALAQELQALLSSLITRSEKVSEMAECLEDILNLPYWERRCDLYSAWILTQITKGLQDTGIVYHVTNNALSFSFHKTMLATCEKLKPTLQIWIELRTETSNPLKGKGRKKHIQPDYTLAIDDAMNPANTVAVVECKQYKRSNGSNFFAAIYDYASGRPQGNVFLVNYGPVSENLMSKGTQKLKERAFPYGYVRPYGKNADAFMKKLKDVIYGYYRTRAARDPRFLYPWTEPDTPCTIELKWGLSPKDLDLWLCLRMRDGICSKIWFQHPGQLDTKPFAYLDCDCQNGFGRETIKIQHWLDADYDVVISNYSGEAVVDGDIEIHISCGQDHYCLMCTKPWNDPLVWHTVHLDSFGFQIVHRCVRNEWSTP